MTTRSRVLIAMPLAIVLLLLLLVASRSAYRISSGRWSVEAYTLSLDYESVSFLPGYQTLARVEGQLLASRDYSRGERQFLGLGSAGAMLDGAEDCSILHGPSREWLANVELALDKIRRPDGSVDQSQLNTIELPVAEGRAAIECKTSQGVVSFDARVLEMGCIISPALQGLTEGYNQRMKQLQLRELGDR